MRLATLPDIHKDYENLLKIVGEAEARGFDKLICLGDISGFVKGFYTEEKEFQEHFAFMQEHECSLCFTRHAERFQ